MAAGEYEPATNSVFHTHKRAPVSPDGTYVAYVVNTNDFANQIINTNNIYKTSPYNNPLSVLGPPTQLFYDIYESRLTNEITKVVEPEYWTLPDKATPVICEISPHFSRPPAALSRSKCRRRFITIPTTPTAVDFIVFGNSFYAATGGPTANNFANMNVVPIAGIASTYGHTTTVAVSQDGTNWYTYPYVPVILPSDSNQWDVEITITSCGKANLTS